MTSIKAAIEKKNHKWPTSFYDLKKKRTPISKYWHKSWSFPNWPWGPIKIGWHPAKWASSLSPDVSLVWLLVIQQNQRTIASRKMKVSEYQEELNEQLEMLNTDDIFLWIKSWTLVTWTGTWWKRMSFQYYSWHSRFILYVLVSTVSLCMQHTFLELYIWFMVHKFLIICRVVSCWWLSQLWQSIEWWCLCTLNVHIECFNSLSGKR